MTIEAVATSASRNTWQRTYAKRLFASDLAVIAFAVFASQFFWINDRGSALSFEELPAKDLSLTYTAVSLVLVVLWLIFLDLFATRDHKNIGSGTTEYKRLADSTVRLFGILAIVAFLFKADLGRGYFLTALPGGLLLLLLSRWAWR